MEPVITQGKLKDAETTAAQTTQTAATDPGKAETTKAGGENLTTKQEIKQPELGIGERTQMAVNTLLDTMAETDRPTDDYQLKALATLKGQDLSKMTDGARAKLILDTAKKLIAFEKASEPKEALKQAVQMPGGGNAPAAQDDVQTRFQSKDPKVNIKAAKELAFKNLLENVSPQTAVKLKQQAGITE